MARTRESSKVGLFAGGSHLAAHPILDRLATRTLERREVVRHFVLSGEAEGTEPAAVVLRATNGESTVFTDWPACVTGSRSAQVVRGFGSSRWAQSRL